MSPFNTNTQKQLGKHYIYFLCNSVLYGVFISTAVKSVHQIYKLPIEKYYLNVVHAVKHFFPCLRLWMFFYDAESHLLRVHIGLFLFTFLYLSEQWKNPEVHTVSTTSCIEENIVLN